MVLGLLHMKGHVFDWKFAVQAPRRAMQLALLSGVAAFVSASAQSTPFSGTPVSIPGVIQAVNYDLGGEGVAFQYSPPSGYTVTNYYRSDPVGMQTN